MVKIPGIYVDDVVIAAPEDHQQTYDCQYDPSLSGEHRAPGAADEVLPMSAKKIIGRRGALELTENAVVNLGVGGSEYVASVAGEEGIADTITLTVEGGAIGGVPQGGVRFGSSAMPMPSSTIRISSTSTMAALGYTTSGPGSVRQHGQHQRQQVWYPRCRLRRLPEYFSADQKRLLLWHLTAGGLKVAVEDGKVKILKEGKSRNSSKPSIRLPSTVPTPLVMASASSTSPNAASLN